MQAGINNAIKNMHLIRKVRTEAHVVFRILKTIRFIHTMFIKHWYQHTFFLCIFFISLNANSSKCLLSASSFIFIWAIRRDCLTGAKSESSDARPDFDFLSSLILSFSLTLTLVFFFTNFLVFFLPAEIVTDYDINITSNFIQQTSCFSSLGRS